MRNTVLLHLIIINALVWLAGLRFPWLRELLPLYKYGYGFKWWQPLSYFFMHASWWHILVNMIVLWSLGLEVEAVLGKRQFLRLYFFVGIASGLCLAFLDPSPVAVVGASTSISGILAAYAYFFPSSHLVIFPVPIPISAKWLALGFGLISLGFLLWAPAWGGISHFGHLCGLVLGWVYVRWLR
ncbi:MAG: rhomboid family intramembrane serine protease [Bacteroidia bacterium]|nr:rhomboid family intramembrane serine protease [Bacteroidia bacterium]MDW8088432.1 rhomboid family intramembrane serine protease [Bacteroidia bacterium]